MRFAVIRSTVIDTYEPLINKLVRHDKYVRKYGKWLPAAEAREFCENKLLEYEAGWQLTEWEAKCEGDQDKLNGHVYVALRGDLLNHARTKVDRIRKGEHRDSREYPVPNPGDFRSERDEPASSTPRVAKVPPARQEYDQNGKPYRAEVDRDYYAGPLPRRPRGTVRDAESPDAKLERYPLLSQRYKDRLTVATIAAEGGFSLATAKRRIRDERERYIGEHPAEAKPRLGVHVNARLRSGMYGFGGRGAIDYGDESATWRVAERKPLHRASLSPAA